MDSARDHALVQRPKVIIVAPRVAASFVSQDADLLSPQFDTSLISVRGVSSLARLYTAVRSADAIVMWFVGRHSIPTTMLARTFGVPLVTVIGGFEVAWVPELMYGIRPGSMKEHILERIVSASTLVLSVSEYSYKDAVARFPGQSHRFMVIPNAVDTNRFTPPEAGKRQGVISVGVINKETIGRKSWGLFVDTARELGDIPFKMIGPANDFEGKALVQSLPSNVTWLGELGHAEIVAHLQSASVYLQLSVYESFCLALAEGMSCGCFPVVSDRAALPEVIGQVGEIDSTLTAKSVSAKVLSALSRPDSQRTAVRTRILRNYSLDIRQERLSQMLRQLLATRRIQPK